MAKRFDDHNELDFEDSNKRNRPVRGQRIDWNAGDVITPPSGITRPNGRGGFYKSPNEVNRG